MEFPEMAYSGANNRDSLLDDPTALIDHLQHEDRKNALIEELLLRHNTINDLKDTVDGSTFLAAPSKRRLPLGHEKGKTTIQESESLVGARGATTNHVAATIKDVGDLKNPNETPHMISSIDRLEGEKARLASENDTLRNSTSQLTMSICGLQHQLIQLQNQHEIQINQMNKLVQKLETEHNEKTQVLKSRYEREVADTVHQLKMFQGEPDVLSMFVSVEECEKLEKKLRHALANTDDRKVELMAEEKNFANKLCNVCEEFPKTTIFIPCGHICCCNACSARSDVLKDCPICRTAITQRFKAYF